MMLKKLRLKLRMQKQIIDLIGSARARNNHVNRNTDSFENILQKSLFEL